MASGTRSAPLANLPQAVAKTQAVSELVSCLRTVLTGSSNVTSRTLRLRLAVGLLIYRGAHGTAVSITSPVRHRTACAGGDDPALPRSPAGTTVAEARRAMGPLCSCRGANQYGTADD